MDSCNIQDVTFMSVLVKVSNVNHFQTQHRYFILLQQVTE